ncbi:MAG: hypothetical protein N4A46_02270, partial [Schleiferiaceae bacterium]|nr:hypothetical protein [Schleiferiaceae bacterium]
MKKIITPLIFLFAFSLSAQYACQDIKLASGFNKQSINNNAKSDSIDIFHYHINLDATKITSQSLIADTELKFASKIAGVSFMEIDLLKLNIDSIYCTWPISNYNYNDTLIRINFGNNLTVNDTQYMTIYYHGTPQGDATGWGGFHFASPYYYNLGVGFGADPHTYGRAWFPCFDNFVEKSTYSFAVKTEGGRKAYCNGVRTAFTHLGGDTLINYWYLTEPIPTYLASVAISDYEEINSTHNGMPVMLVARAGDTTKLKNSFTNMTQTYDAYVSHFGPYMWQKMGYALTTQGAMEHATSI